MSVRFRLMLIFTAMTAIILGSFSVFIYYSTVSMREDAFLDRLWERSEISYQLLMDSPKPDLGIIHPSVRNTYWTTLPDEEIIVFDDDDHCIYINEFIPATIDYRPILQKLKKAGKIEIVSGKRQLVGITKKIDDITYFIIVSAFDKNGQRLLSKLKITLLSSYLVSILIILLAGWYFSRETYKPVERIIETAEKLSERDLHLRVPIPKGKNELVRLVNTINDSLDRLQKSFEVHKTFVANASHELRTPLTALRGELEVALLKKRSSEEYRNFLSVAFEDAKRLSHLVNHLLLFAQTTSDRRGFDFLPVRIDELVMDVMQKLMINYPDQDIDFRFTGDLPDDSNLIIHGNENLLSVAFTNILDNAIKYSDNTPVHIEIETRHNLEVKIRDFGIGISPQDLDKIFEPFYRSKCSTDVAGFGLGLPLASQIIELHGGKIMIESKINKGTLASISFPNNL